MICPKCGFDQPDGPECLRCGIIISRYKGPVLGEAARPAAPQPPAPPSQISPAAMGVGGTVYRGPEPEPAVPAMAAAAGGTVFEGPVPVVAAVAPVPAGTIYEGPPPGAPPPSPASTQPAVRGEFEVSKVLGETFSIYFRNFVPFLLLTCVALSPMILSLLVILNGSLQGMGLGMAIASLILLILSAIFCPQLATASITYGVFQQMRGRDVSIADCLKRGLSALFPVVGLVLVQGLGILAGLLLLIVPGIILALRWSVSVPAAVEEKHGIFEALQRSTFLTAGYRWTIFAILFIVNVLGNSLTKLLEKTARGDLPSLLMGIVAISLLSVGFTATATAVMYYRLRSIKEGIGVDRIPSVFA